MDSETSHTGRPDKGALPRFVLTAVWLFVTVTLTLMLLDGARDSGRFRVERYILHVVYVAALLWYFGRTGFVLSRLTEPGPLLLRGWRIHPLTPVFGLTVLLLFTAFSDDGLDVLLLFLMMATLWTLVAWRRDIRLRSLVQGLALAVVVLPGGLLIVKNGFAAKSFIVLFSVFVPLMFMAGGQLHHRTGLGGSRLHEGRYGDAMKSFLRGCLLFVPLGLNNAANGSPGTGITWVTEAWMPLVLPWFSGLSEEMWFRFLLVGLCFFLLRPALRTKPAAAILAAVLFSAITFGLGHGRALETFLTTGFLYGLPLAVIFAGRDLEHAAGGHYMVNMIPWFMVFLET